MSLLDRARRTVEHPWRVALVVIGMSLVVRLAVFTELSTGPCLWQHRWAQTDMNYFDSWARRVASGDWLARGVGVPMHGWHRLVAADHLNAHPFDAANLATDSDAEAALWSRWTGAPRFYQEPLYPYLIAVTYSIFGEDPRYVFAWQMALGIGINVLVHLLSRRVFGAVCGAIAGVLAALYAPLLSLELVLLRDVLIVFTGLVLVLLLMRAIESARWCWWGAAGVAAGLAFLLKSTLLITVAALVTGAVLELRSRRRPARRLVAVAALGLTLGVAPLVVRNVAVGVDPLSTASGGTATFVSTNAEDYPSEEGGFYVSRHAARILGASEARFFPAALATLRTHPGPLSYFRQVWEKFTGSLRWYEIPNNENFYYQRVHSAVLRNLPVTFFIVGPLAIVGLALARRRTRECWPLYVLVASTAVPLLAFMTMSRLRLPLAVALIPFAAHAVAEVGRWLARRSPGDGRRAAVAALAAIALLAWTGSGHGSPSQQIRVADYIEPLKYYYLPEVMAAAKTGDSRRASAILAEFLETEPDSVRLLGPGRPPANEWERTLAGYYLFARTEHAWELTHAGDSVGALRESARAGEMQAALK